MSYSPNMPPSRLSGAIAWASREFQKIKLTFDKLVHILAGADNKGATLYWNDEKWIDTNAVSIDPAGAVELYHAGSSVLSTRSSGAEVDSSAGTPTLAFLASGTQIGQVFGNTGNSKFIFRNEQAAGLVEFQGTPTGGGLVALAAFDPDGSVDLRYNGEKVFETADGAIVLSRTTVGDKISLYGDRLNLTTMYGFGVEASTLYYKSAGVHRFYSRANADGGTSDVAELGSSGFFTPHGILVGPASGGFKGNGIINAQAVYDDNTLLTDYVFDAALDGRIDVETWDDKVPDRVDEEGNVERRKHLPARDFQGRMVELDPSIYAASWKRNRKLPAFARGEEQKSVGDIVQRLIETCEVQAVHIEKLRQRIEVLEQNNV